jgi:serine/threonine protein kinase
MPTLQPLSQAILHCPATAAYDIWSAACTIFEAATGRTLFPVEAAAAARWVRRACPCSDSTTALRLRQQTVATHWLCFLHLDPLCLVCCVVSANSTPVCEAATGRLLPGGCCSPVRRLLQPGPAAAAARCGSADCCMQCCLLCQPALTAALSSRHSGRDSSMGPNIPQHRQGYAKHCSSLSPLPLPVVRPAVPLLACASLAGGQSPTVCTNLNGSAVGMTHPVTAMLTSARSWMRCTWP